MKGTKLSAWLLSVCLLLSLLPTAALAAAATESETQGSGGYSMNCTIVYHSNYPDGTDVQKTINYTIYAGYNIANTGKSVNLKSPSALGFTAPNGYTFKWWAASKDGNTDPVKDSYFCSNNATVHLYAQYNSNSPVPTTYTVSFHANGGSGTMTAATGVSGSYTLPICGFTAPSGKRFKGWATSAGGAVISGATVTISGNTTLYAIWEDIPAVTYTVSFHANGGSGTMAAATGVSGSYTLPICDFTAPNGKRFKGWATSAGGAVISGATVTISGNTTLYAIWETAAPDTTFESQGSGPYSMTCTIVYHRNGPDEADTTRTVIYTVYAAYNIAGTGRSVTLKSCSDLGFAAPDGHQLQNDPWNTAADGSGEKLRSQLFCANNAAVHLYAQWEASVCTVSFNSQGGSEVNAASVSIGGRVARPANPTRSGYTFGGWYRESACATAWNFSADTVTEDITLYAKWTANRNPGGNFSGGIGGSSGGSTPAVTVNGDGSTTTSVTDSRTGAVTETTTNPDGSVTTVVTEKDGAVTATKKTADGVTATTVTGADGAVSSVKASIPAGAADAGAVILPVMLPADTAVDITVAGGSAVTVEIPTENVTSGAVAVLAYPDGSEKVVRKSVATENGVSLVIDGSATVKIIDNSREFADVPASSWAADVVAFASSHELLNGTGAGTFSPDMPMTRGMLAQALYNLEGNPAQADDRVFADIRDDAWYADAVAWAAANGFATGFGNGIFAPDNSITREQLAVMLWRYSGSPAATNKELHFNDTDEISGYALEALRWAVENGVLNGYGDGRLGPKGQATRVQVAQMLKNYLER